MEDDHVIHVGVDGVVSIEDFLAFFLPEFNVNQRQQMEAFRRNTVRELAFDIPGIDEQTTINYALRLVLERLRRVNFAVRLEGDWGQFVNSRRLSNWDSVRLRWSDGRILLLYVNPLIKFNKKERSTHIWPKSERMKPLKKRQMRKPISGWKENQVPQMIVARANEPVSSDVFELQTHFLIVTVEDISRLRSLDLTLLYKFGHGSFGVQMYDYEKAVEVLCSPDITLLCRDSSETSLIALRDLLMFILTLNSQTLSQAKLALAQAMTPATLPRIATFYLETSHNKELYILLDLANSIAMRPNPEPILTNSNSKTIKCRTFAALVASMKRRWPKWRLVLTSHGFALSTASLGSDNNSVVCVLGKQMLLSQPDSHTSGLSDSKRLVKEWSFKVKVDHLVRFICQVVPTSSELDMESIRNLSLGEYIALLLHVSFGELKLMVADQHALRDTCCIMEHKLGKLYYDESVFGTFESGSELLVRGSRIDITTKFRYDGGLDNWMSSRRSTSTDDGEMMSCDICESWQHRRSTGIEDTEAVAPLFICPRCSW